METAINESREAEMLSEIRDAEKKSDEIIERAGREKESILHQASFNSSKMLIAKEDELRKLREKKLMEFQDKARLIKDEKIAEGKAAAKQLKAKAEKNIPKAVEFTLKKFEEMV